MPTASPDPLAAQVAAVHLMLQALPLLDEVAPLAAATLSLALEQAGCAAPAPIDVVNLH